MRATVMYGAGDVRVVADAKALAFRVLAATGSVIDELMGHEGGRMERGVSPMGALYREPRPRC